MTSAVLHDATMEGVSNGGEWGKEKRSHLKLFTPKERMDAACSGSAWVGLGAHGVVSRMGAVFGAAGGVGCRGVEHGLSRLPVTSVSGSRRQAAGHRAARWRGCARWLERRVLRDRPRSTSGAGLLAASVLAGRWPGGAGSRERRGEKQGEVAAAKQGGERRLGRDRLLRFRSGARLRLLDGPNWAECG
jgi:hypothetical protein